MNVKLIKMESNHDRLRTEEVEGECIDLPVAGQTFTLFGKPIDPEANVRVVRTSIVQEVKKEGNVMTFKTLNSIYQLFVQEEL